MRRRIIRNNLTMILFAFALMGSGVAVLGLKGFAGNNFAHGVAIRPYNVSAGKVIGRNESSKGNVIMNCSGPENCRYEFSSSDGSIYYTAQPSAGYKFVRWEYSFTGDKVSFGRTKTGATLRATKNKNWVIRANFKKIDSSVSEPSKISTPAITSINLDSNLNPTIRWTAFADKSVKFEVVRTNNNQLGKEVPNDSWESLTTTAAGASSWTDDIDESDPAGTYYYSIRAIKDSNSRSEYSNIVSKDIVVMTDSDQSSGEDEVMEDSGLSAVVASLQSQVSALFNPSSSEEDFDDSGAENEFAEEESFEDSESDESFSDSDPEAEAEVSEESGDEESLLAANSSDAENSSDLVVPADLTAKYDGNKSSVELSWTSNGNSNSANYSVERTEKGKNTWKVINNTKYLTYSDTGFESDKTYSYRVRSFRENERSEYSEVVEVSVTKVSPNVTVSDGGAIYDEDKLVLIEFPANATQEDLFVSITKIRPGDIVLPDSSFEISGIAFRIEAKNSSGEVVDVFRRQIYLYFPGIKVSKSKINSAKIGVYKDGKASFLKTSIRKEDGALYAATNHFSDYFVAVPKDSAGQIFARVIAWILVVIGLGVALFVGYNFWQRKMYQEEHAEDFIYRH